MKQKRSNTAIYVAGGLLVALLVLRRGVKANVITPIRTANYVKRIRIQIAGVKFKKTDVQFDVHIMNPNETPVTIKSIVGDIYFESNNGKTVYKLGNVTRFGITAIKPNGETIYPFAIRLKLLNLTAYFSDLYAGKLHGQVLRFIGTININGSDYGINESYKIA